MSNFEKFCTLLVEKDQSITALRIFNQICKEDFYFVHISSAIVNQLILKKNYIQAIKVAHSICSPFSLLIYNRCQKERAFNKIAHSVISDAPPLTFNPEHPFYKIKEYLGLKLTTLEKIEKCLDCIFRSFLTLYRSTASSCKRLWMVLHTGSVNIYHSLFFRSHYIAL